MTSTIDASAIKEVAQLSRDLQAQRDRVLLVNSEPPDVYYLRGIDGSLERVVAEPTPRGISFLSVVDMISFAESFSSVEFFYSPDTIWVQIFTESADGKLRSNKYDMELPKHVMREKLANLAGKQFSQQSLVKKLRTEFATAVSDAIIESFRVLKFSTVAEGSSRVKVGNSSVAKSIANDVAQENGARVPESITFNIPVYDVVEVYGKTYPVTVLVDCDQDDSGRPYFELTPVITDLEAADFDALNDVVSPLHGQTEFKVYHGELRG